VAGFYRETAGGVPKPSENQAVILVDKNGVPTGGFSNGGTTYISNQLFTITTSAVLGSSPALTIPPATISGKVTVFSNSQSDQWVGRFYRDGTAPTNTAGIPVNNADERQFDSIAGLAAWRFRKLDEIASVTVLVEYWGA
jgi:hypothetical protein